MILDLFDLVDALPDNHRLMGLDLGTKTIGLALSDLSLTIASPITTIQREKFTKDVTAMLAIATKLDVGGLVLGYPLDMDGRKGPRAQASESFARNLSRLTSLPLTLWDERLSTVAVTRTLLEADTSRKRRSELVDKLAATYILQGALDRLRNGWPQEPAG